MATIPKLALIPSGYKAGKIYSVLPTSGVGDFDFTRDTIATRINSSGLIETVASGIPRLNYPLIDGVVNGCPSVLLEPLRSNIIPYSESFSNAAWVKGSSTINANQVISPDGTLNADLMVTSAAGGGVSDGIGGSGDYSFSVFVKYKDIQFIRLRSTSSYAWFDIENGSVGTTISALDAKIEDYGNGWYRCTLVGNNTNTIVQVTCTEQNSSNIGFGSVYLWGAQFESGSYETSYIKSDAGGTVTRSAETANGAGDASTFNDSEGVLFAEISALADDVAYEFISLSDGTLSNRVSLFLSNTNTLNGSADGVSSIASVADIKNNNKAAYKYKSGDYALWVNGFEVGISTTTTGNHANLNRLNFDYGQGSNDFYGNTKQLQYFDSALTDSELETLTSWVSFSDMANGQLYTIE